MQSLTNESMVQLCRSASKAYLMDEDYHSAVAILQELINLAEQIPPYDRLILDYLKGIHARYAQLLISYESTIDKQVEEKAEEIFPGNNYKTWQAAKNGAAIYEKLKIMGRRSNAATKKKTLWYKLIKQFQSEMEFTLHSGKK
jgi:phosphotransferase system HPr-like phosphotransfer protein